MSVKSECYACPLENLAFENCQGCPFHTREGGKDWCHLATLNFAYDGKPCELGLFPVVFAREYHKAELRYVMQDGVKVAQINVSDLEGTGRTSQEPVSKLAADKMPSFRRRKKSSR